MSSPSVNRWGINVFWYNFWYSDKFYAKNVHQDSIFLKLINTYIYHGIHLKKNMFWNRYWYINNFKNYNYIRYYRWINIKNPNTGVYTKYIQRVNLKDIYPMKIWILKYNNWFILNLYWFQPYKNNEKIKNKYKIKKPYIYTVPKKKTLKNLIKLKTLVSSYFLNKVLFNKIYKF